MDQPLWVAGGARLDGTQFGAAEYRSLGEPRVDNDEPPRGVREPNKSDQ